MTQLLRTLEEKDDENIPLLIDEVNPPQNAEENGLFTEQELIEMRRSRRLKLVLKLVAPISFLVILLLSAVRTYRHITYTFLNQPVDYNIQSISLDNMNDFGFDLSVNATIETNIPWGAKLSGLALQINNPNDLNTSIISAQFPEMKIESGESIPINVRKQSIRIHDKKAFASVVNKSLKDKKLAVPITVKSAKLHPNWFPFDLRNFKINKIIEANLETTGEGIDLSKYVKLVDLQMEEAANDDLIVTAKLSIQNPFPLSVEEIPEVSFKIYYSEERILVGKLRTTEKIRLRNRKSSLVSLQAHLSGSSDSRSSNAISELITNFLLGKTSRIYLRGDEEASGEKLNWLQSILIHLDIPIDIPGKKGGMFEDSIKKIDVKRLQFALDPEQPTQILLDSEAEVHFNVPRIASMMKPKIESLSLEGRVSDQQGNFLAPLIVPDHKVESSLSHENALNTSMKMNINVDHMNMDNIESMLAEMLYSQDTVISVQGHSSVKTRSFLGRMTVPKVPFAADIRLPSMGRIISSQILEFKDLKFLGSDAGENLNFSVKIEINNPTEITSKMGPMSLICLQESSRQGLGTIYIKDATIKPGKNEFNCLMSLNKSEHLESLIGNLLSGGNEQLLLQGSRGSEIVHPILKNVIGAFVMKVNADSLNLNLSFVSSVVLRRKGFNLLPEIFMTVSNPFPFEIKIHSVQNLHVFGYDVESGELILITKMDQVPLEEAIIIPPNVKNFVDEENPLPIQINGNVLRSLKALQLLFNKENPVDENGKKYLPVKIEGIITSEMDSMKLTFKFIKDRLPLYLDIGLL